MEIEFVTTLNNVHSTTLSTKPVSKTLQHVKSELRRLATFRSSKEKLHPTLSKGHLAKAGFFYVETEQKVKCEACHFEIELSISDIDPIEEHRKHNPECQFVLAQNDLFPKNNQELLLFASNMSQTNVLDTNHQNDRNDDTNDQQDDPSPQKLFLNTLSKEMIDKIRTNTFANWPLITPSAQDMIVAGWSYTNIADRVMCIHCNILFHKWTESDRPYEIHRLKSPQCSFVLSTEKKTANASTTITITTEPNTQAVVGAANTAYTLAYRRHETFEKWPQSEENSLPSIESFVDAGFFYTGEKTIVRCFYCNNALRNWQATDDPKIEHARWYPQCAYIRQYIGEDLFQAIQRKNRELKAQQNNQENSIVQNSQIAPWTDDEIDRMVKARLDLPIVEKLRQMGFSMSIIRKTYEMQLKFKKDDFKTDNDLRLACLILDQQVKMINGNQNNILVPQDWMKNFIEDQERNVQQPEPQQTRASQPPIKNNEILKVVASIAPRPKITQETDEEAMPCVLCLTTERQVACLPCGHLSSCVACGHSLKTCPICRATVKAFVRIYV